MVSLGVLIYCLACVLAVLGLLAVGLYKANRRR